MAISKLKLGNKIELKIFIILITVILHTLFSNIFLGNYF